MAEGFEPYHVPQQSRREKLRVLAQNQPGCIESHQVSRALAQQLYDPSLNPSSDLINLQHHQTLNLGSSVKEEGTNFMGFLGGMSMVSSSSSSGTNHMYLDPESSVQLNPSSINDINGNPYVYTPHGLRVLDQSFHGNEMALYKPQALSISHEGNSNSAAAQTVHGLSLSLSSHQTNLPLELNLQRYDPSMFNSNKVVGGYVVSLPGGDKGCGSTSHELSRSSVPLGPFTGYASVLKGSRFLKPAQQLLEELCGVGREVYGEAVVGDPSSLDHPSPEGFGDGNVDDLSSGGGERTRKKSKLLLMLDEVYSRYKQYCQQMQAVVASFESVAGLSNAAPFANLALKVMSKHFKRLKNAITDQLLSGMKSEGLISNEGNGAQGYGNSGRGIYSQGSFHNSRYADQPVWRPQRGLPERAVTVLRAWLFDHFLHPYPTDTDKLMLAKQTGLSRNQVSNWFINARVRLWKPMVEEIHMLETRQCQKPSQREGESATGPDNHLTPGCSIEYENTSASAEPSKKDFSSKRTRNHFSETPMHDERPASLPCHSMPRYADAELNAGGSSGGVSLTLGLHQNVMSLPEAYPLHIARHFGLDGHGEGYIVSSGFAAQNRQFGRDVVGGQLLHDFVG